MSKALIPNIGEGSVAAVLGGGNPREIGDGRQLSEQWVGKGERKKSNPQNN